MNVDEARGRLMKTSAYMGADQAIADSLSAADMRQQLQIVFSQHADKPIIVQRLLQALIDEIIADQTPGYNHPLVLMLCKFLRNTLESVAFLASEGFSEAAWFRASDALESMGIYLDGIEWAEQHEPVAVGAPDG